MATLKSDPKTIENILHYRHESFLLCTRRWSDFTLLIWLVWNDLTTFCFVSLIWRDFQNWRLRSRSQTVGHPEEPARHELWQTEPLHTSVLQEGHHSKAGRVSQAGVPVRPPRIMDVRMDMCKICWTYWVYSGSDVNATALSFGLHSRVFVFFCTDCLLNYALLPIMITIWLYCSFSCFVHVLRPQLSVVLIGKPAEQSAYSLNQTHFIL